MENRIITISRQFGSGGRTIGKAVAEKLGIPCYDKELIEMFAAESGFSEEYIKSNSELVMHKGWLASVFSDRTYDTPHTQDVLWDVQQKVIHDLAEKGPCVIIGRGADYILRDRTDCLRVFIHAEKSKRADRILRVYGGTDVPVMKRIEDKDERRRAYYQKYTNRSWGDAENYHLSLDSLTLGMDTCVRLLEELY